MWQYWSLILSNTRPSCAFYGVSFQSGGFFPQWRKCWRNITYINFMEILENSLSGCRQRQERMKGTEFLSTWIPAQWCRPKKKLLPQISGRNGKSQSQLCLFKGENRDRSSLCERRFTFFFPSSSSSVNRNCQDFTPPTPFKNPSSSATLSLPSSSLIHPPLSHFIKTTVKNRWPDLYRHSSSLASLSPRTFVKMSSTQQKPQSVSYLNFLFFFSLAEPDPISAVLPLPRSIRWTSIDPPRWSGGFCYRSEPLIVTVAGRLLGGCWADGGASWVSSESKESFANYYCIRPSWLTSWVRPSINPAISEMILFFLPFFPRNFEETRLKIRYARFRLLTSFLLGNYSGWCFRRRLEDCCCSHRAYQASHPEPG